MEQLPHLHPLCSPLQSTAEEEPSLGAEGDITVQHMQVLLLVWHFLASDARTELLRSCAATLGKVS